MIDLHIHTNYSDGTNTPKEVLKKAEDMKLEIISITDHNNCDAYKELQNREIRKEFNGKILPGIELNTKILGIPIEILGYGIDTKKMNNIVKDIYISPEERNKLEMERIYIQCKKAGLLIAKEDIEKYDCKMFTSKYLHNLLRRNEYNRNFIDKDSWEDSNIFYRKYMSNPKSIFYINMDDVLPEFDTLSKVLKKVNGLLFIPHIFEYKDNSMMILKNIIDNHKIDGIECFYTTFSNEQTKYLLNICKNLNLYVSGGSDYHGENKPKVEIGKGYGDLQISKKYVNNWIEEVKLT